MCGAAGGVILLIAIPNIPPDKLAEVPKELLYAAVVVFFVQAAILVTMVVSLLTRGAKEWFEG